MGLTSCVLHIERGLQQLRAFSMTLISAKQSLRFLQKSQRVCKANGFLYVEGLHE